MEQREQILYLLKIRHDIDPLITQKLTEYKLKNGLKEDDKFIGEVLIRLFNN